MTAVELIERKRDGGTLTGNEIRWLIAEYTAGTVTDYQMSAMLMAVFINGLNGEELTVWTESMLTSGEVLELSEVPGRKVDKHSTGGVGDKISIPLAPMVGACGVKIPMMSGRGLGHTGGTLDKLETIPGFRTGFTADQFAILLAEHGVVLGGQSEQLVPADRKLYALRDATGTVPAIPLIASSIMSKKLAEDLDGLVLDVKFGRGAFMEDIDDARRLAETMVEIGDLRGTRVVALLTDMSQPLGREVGNASEIRESIDTLRGEGPDDITELTYALGAEMLIMGEVATSVEEAHGLLEQAVSSGSAMAKFAEIVTAQGGDASVLEAPDTLPTAFNTDIVTAPQSGWISRCDALSIGVGAMRLGAGRERKEDTIDPAVGVTVEAKVGDRVNEGDVLGHIHWNDAYARGVATPLITSAWEISDSPVDAPALIVERIGS
ncbi:MAG: thymidine phosphorylase [Acidimicrobiia bacterium]